MLKKFLFVSVLFLFPMAFVAAQYGPQADYGAIGRVITNTLTFINRILVPAVFAIAFLVFIWGVFKYFIMGGASEGDQEAGKQLMIYGIIGFVLMVSVWGLVNVVASGLGFKQDSIQDIPSVPITR
ncbi:pilin [Patescibacteria group bacterium]|nr:pilin [Patescibacteria group bacterium]